MKLFNPNGIVGFRETEEALRTYNKNTYSAVRWEWESVRKEFLEEGTFIWSLNWPRKNPGWEQGLEGQRDREG